MSNTVKRLMHISTRTDLMLCGTEDVSGVLRRYLTCTRYDNAHVTFGVQLCRVCVELEPLALLHHADLVNDPDKLCKRGCGKPGTHFASYDMMWTCEQCIE